MAEDVPDYGDKFCPHCGVKHEIEGGGGGPHSGRHWLQYRKHPVAECTRNLLKQLVKVRGLGSPHLK